MRLGKYLTSLTKPELEELKELLNLTEDEEMVFNGLVKGYNLNKISDCNNISDRTVSRIIERICCKVEKVKEGLELKREIPVCEKFNLTVDEAAAYFNVGADRIREIADEHKSDMVIMVGVKKLIKRKKMEEYMDKAMVL